MSKIIPALLFFIMSSSFALKAQKSYTATAGETILSMGIVDAGAADLQPVVRFSPVFNFQQQLHFNFSNSFGFYSGLGIRNVGLISHFDDSLGNTVKIKERAYSLGLPLALKFGDFDGGANIAIGGEAELMFAYKRKLKYEGDKDKLHDWFDDRVNLFNPSVFIELKFQKGQYIRAKYYIFDFLNYKGIILNDDGETYLPDYGESSPLFYISFGTVTLKKKISSEETETKSAFFRTKKNDVHFASFQ